MQHIIISANILTVKFDSQKHNTLSKNKEINVDK